MSKLKFKKKNENETKQIHNKKNDILLAPNETKVIIRVVSLQKAAKWSNYFLIRIVGLLCLLVFPG